jgi:glycosyltransferase involved in cell wall biosynthesis
LNNAPHYREEIYLLIDSKFDVDFFIGDSSNATNIRKMDLGLFSKPPAAIKFHRIFRSYHWYSNSIKLIFNKKYHIYVMTGEPICISSWIILMMGRLLGKDVSLWSHGFYGREKGIRRFIKKWYYKLASRVLLYGNHSKRIMIELGFDAARLPVVYNSLFYQKQLKIRKQLEGSFIEPIFKNGLPITIFVGRLTRDKKVELLIKALYSSIENGRIKFNILIIGDGQEKMNLVKLVNEYGLQEQVYLMGACYDEQQIARYFSVSDICISPGEIGLTGIHAMSYGVPVITHDDFGHQMPEFEAIRKGVNGDFFRRNDADDLSMVIDRWLKRYPSKSNVVRQHCYDIIDNVYNPDRQIGCFSFLEN